VCIHEIVTPAQRRTPLHRIRWVSPGRGELFAIHECACTGTPAADMREAAEGGL
jgi:hypothetical protein